MEALFGFILFIIAIPVTYAGIWIIDKLFNGIADLYDSKGDRV